MVPFLFSAHSGWRYVVIAVTLVALAKYLYGRFGNGQWGDWDRRLGLTVPTVFDIQLLLGLVLWIAASGWTLAASKAWEHPVTMIIAVIITHLTWRRVKGEADDPARFRTALVGYLIAAIVMGLGVWRITSI
ncbi:MAG: hypothetical protein H3C34_26040 [Caldilineaceae bacterium]|nr:hypothetical protein [Caldilineaceae bacterium]